MDTKLCNMCKSTKEVCQFYKQTTSKDGLYSYCKDCVKAKNAKYYKSNKLACNTQAAEWKKSNRQRARELNKLSKARNRGFFANKEAIRRAAKHQATPKWANEFIISEIYELAALRSKMTGFKWEVDHIIPLKGKLVCGFHVETNLQVIPALLNRKKHNKYIVF